MGQLLGQARAGGSGTGAGLGRRHHRVLSVRPVRRPTADRRDEATAALTIVRIYIASFT